VGGAQWGVVGEWGQVGGEVSKSGKKRNWAGGRGENKVPEKKNWEGGREKIKLQKETEIRAEKGQRKKNSTWDGTWIEKRNPSVHHPSPSIHVGALVGAGFLWPHRTSSSSSSSSWCCSFVQ